MCRLNILSCLLLQLVLFGIFAAKTTDEEYEYPDFFYDQLKDSNPANHLTRPSLMNGLVFPSKIDALIEEGIYFKIIEPVEKQTRCVYQVNGGIEQDARRPHKPNIVQWDRESCGLHIKSVAADDAGIWRLTSENSTKSIARGAVLITVNGEKKQPINRNHIISLGDAVLNDEMTYCYLSRPDKTTSVNYFSENCSFPPFHNEQEANGVWDVRGGVKGKTEEISFQVKVQTKAEDIQTFLQYTKTALNMKCSLINSQKTMKFCRFVRLNDDEGFNLEEGRGNERYRYFGSGFKRHECGISLTNPLESDRSPWKCFIGVEMEGAEVTTIGSILNASDRDIDDEIDGDDVYAMENAATNILCTRKAVTDYCWFRDPSGQKITLSDRVDAQPTDAHKYFGSGISLGECGITIMKASHNDSGTWTCHMGMIKEARADSNKEISVRITESSLVSTFLLVDANIDSSLSIECKSIPSHVPLDYCRFILPDGTGFSINEKIDHSNPLISKFYFNPNRKLESGYCSLIVNRIDQSHMGQWTCAARLRGYEYESHDEFRVMVFDKDTDTVTAGVSGMLIGAIILVCSISVLSFITWYRQRKMPSLPRFNFNIRFSRSADAVSISSDNSIATARTTLPASPR